MGIKRPLTALQPDLYAALAPRSFAIVRPRTSVIFDADHTLDCLHPGAWTTWTFDLGPQTVTRPSRISNGTLWCWISITALGTFDPHHGGQLILWDLGRMIEFPPGATVLIPGLLEYSIAKIRPGETRYSLTQYVAAPLAWYRWPAGTHLFSTLWELSSLHT
jgi:hypothetical protein